MTRVIVIYESKYGNTKRVAETIIEGINEIEGIEAVLKEPEHACMHVFYAITWCTRQVASCKNNDKIRKVYIRFNWDYLWGGI